MTHFVIDVQSLVTVADGIDVLLQTAVTRTLAHAAVEPPAALSLVLSDDAQLQQLNRQYRQMDAPTDVLSFPAADSPATDPDEPPYLGDILISVPYAQRQAAAEGHSLADELQLLAVHGTLHLLGYDHLTPPEKAEMWEVQTAVLQQLGIAIQLPDEEDNAS